MKNDIQQGLDFMDRGGGKPLDIQSIKAKGRDISKTNSEIHLDLLKFHYSRA